ncbi:hypothetical protein ACS127_15895 [Amphibacillus sp. Q70]|uniref:hypothetical protein n=1 Tax=Amphibacillus sp. Q70 TaxID=3453416 RepID=UPI003F833875
MKIFERGKRTKIIIFSIIIILIIIVYYNISFSLPKDFSEFIIERTGTESYEEIKQITIQKTEWIENGQIVNVEDDREFIIDDEDDIYSLLNSNVRVYEGGRFSRDEENEYEMYLYFKSGNFHRYHIGEDYIIARQTSDTEEHVFLTVLSDPNDIYHYLIDLYN